MRTDQCAVRIRSIDRMPNAKLRDQMSAWPVLGDGSHDVHNHVDEEVREDCSLKAPADIDPTER